MNANATMPADDKTMHVVLSSDNSYAKYLGVAVYSVLSSKNAEDRYCVHVLDGGICEEEQRRIRDMVHSFGDEVRFIPINDDVFSGKELHILETNHVTVAAYYRLLIPSLVNTDRCIYMDCDMICRASFAPLWATDLNGMLVACVQDIDEEKQALRLGLKNYFNSGLLLMNLKLMREENTQSKFFQFICDHHDRIVWHDQDVMNAVLDERVRWIDLTWNCQVCKTRTCREKGFRALSPTANVLHYIGGRKPWNRTCKAPARSAYWKFCQKSPWAIPGADYIVFEIKAFFCRLFNIKK